MNGGNVAVEAVSQGASLRDRLFRFVDTTTPGGGEMLLLIEALRGGYCGPQMSLLAPGGSPIEAVYRRSWAGGEPAFSFTVEPAGATVAARWARAKTVLAPGLLCGDGFLEELRAQPDQRYGSWIGLRTESGGVAAKLYYEICAGPVRLLALERLGRALSADAAVLAALVPELAGFTADGGEEIYCEVKGARPSLVHALLLLGGAAEGELVLRSALTQLSGLAYGQFLRTKKLWISFRVRAGQATKVSVFVDLHEIVRVDADAARVLRRFLEAPDETRWPDGPDGWSYTMCGLTLRDGGVDVAVGFALPLGSGGCGGLAGAEAPSF